jgi:hypothetical protein
MSTSLRILDKAGAENTALKYLPEEVIKLCTEYLPNFHKKLLEVLQECRMDERRLSDKSSEIALVLETLQRHQAAAMSLYDVSLLLRQNCWEMAAEYQHMIVEMQARLENSRKESLSLVK